MYTGQTSAGAEADDAWNIDEIIRQRDDWQRIEVNDVYLGRFSIVLCSLSHKFMHQTRWVSSVRIH